MGRSGRDNRCAHPGRRRPRRPTRRVRPRAGCTCRRMAPTASMSGARHLYLHVPYCVSKCPYCDFNSIAGREEEHAAYVEALLTEVRRLPRGPYDTVFIGGGTPTQLAPALLARLLEGLAS